MTCLGFLRALHRQLASGSKKKRGWGENLQKWAKFDFDLQEFRETLLERRLIGRFPAISGDTIQKQRVSSSFRSGLVCPDAKTTQVYKLINEYMSKHQINIHTDELIHECAAIFIHHCRPRQRGEKYHYTIIRLPSAFHCPLPNMKYSMYLHPKMPIPFSITAWFASHVARKAHQGRG